MVPECLVRNIPSRLTRQMSSCMFFQERSEGGSVIRNGKTLIIHFSQDDDDPFFGPMNSDDESPVIQEMQRC